MSKVSVKAVATFTAFDDGAMVVANAGDTVELTEATAQNYIDCGLAEAAKGKGKKGGKAATLAQEPEADEGNADAGDDVSEGDAGADAGEGSDDEQTTAP